MAPKQRSWKRRRLNPRQRLRAAANSPRQTRLTFAPAAAEPLQANAEAESEPEAAGSEAHTEATLVPDLLETDPGSSWLERALARALEYSDSLSIESARQTATAEEPGSSSAIAAVAPRVGISRVIYIYDIHM